jgi:hypothetical protein
LHRGLIVTPEGKVKQDVKRWLAQNGFWKAGDPKPKHVDGWYYMPVQNGMGVVGIHDFVCIYKGAALLIETKAGTKTRTPNQLKRHDEVTAAGGFSVVVNDVTKLDYILLQINEVLNGRTVS